MNPKIPSSLEILARKKANLDSVILLEARIILAKFRSARQLPHISNYPPSQRPPTVYESSRLPLLDFPNRYMVRGLARWLEEILYEITMYYGVKYHCYYELCNLGGLIARDLMQWNTEHQINLAKHLSLLHYEPRI